MKYNMFTLWGALLGAGIGMISTHELLGLTVIIGVVLGSIAGSYLDSAIRKEINKEINHAVEPIQEQIDVLRRRSIAPAPRMTTPPVDEAQPKYHPKADKSNEAAVTAQPALTPVSNTSIAPADNAQLEHRTDADKPKEAAAAMPLSSTSVSSTSVTSVGHVQPEHRTEADKPNEVAVAMHSPSPKIQMPISDAWQKVTAPTSTTDSGPGSSPQHVLSQRQSAATPSSRPPSGTQTHAPEVQEYTPDIVAQAFLYARDWLLGGNTIVRMGLVILFIGLSFLVRYAASAGFFPIELRLSAVGITGLSLLSFGFLNRTGKPGFALALQSAGVAVLYLTIFASFKLFDLIPPLLAFGLMIVICALSCALALLQNARVLATGAFLGGFAVPVLLSTGQGSSVGLFSYYTVLNLAILVIAYQRTWRELNLLGFIATFGIASVWGVLKYDPTLYLSSQFFLVVFVLIYLSTAVLYARQTSLRLSGAVDTTLVFGTALVGFGLQVGLVQQFAMGTAFAALGFSALYLLPAVAMMRRDATHYGVLSECFLTVGVGFLTLAVPLGLDMHWTSGVWGLEGAAAFWVGMRQARWMPRAFGLVLQAIAAVIFLGNIDSLTSLWPIFNPVCMGAMLVAVPVALMAWWMRRPLPHSGSSWARAYANVESQLSNLLILVAFVFWCLGCTLEILRTLPGDNGEIVTAVGYQLRPSALMAMLVTNAWLASWIGRRTDWKILTTPGFATPIVLVLGYFAQIPAGEGLFTSISGVLWLLTLGLYYHLLYTNDHQIAAQPERQDLHWLSRATHIGSVWLLTALLSDALWYWIERSALSQTSWAQVVMLVSAVSVLLFLTLWAGAANRVERSAQLTWPRRHQARAYYWVAALPLVVLIYLWALVLATTASGNAAPLPYIPLLNPVDLSVALAVVALIAWRRMMTASDPMPDNAGWVGSRLSLVALGGLVFITINTGWLRVAHHYFGVAWNSHALFNSFVVQGGYAILWTLLALGIMVVAQRRISRSAWLAGATLLGVVVAKLFLIDLSNAGGAERIIAFIGVGFLMLVVGYVAPLPPKQAASANTPDAESDAGTTGFEPVISSHETPAGGAQT